MEGAWTIHPVAWMIFLATVVTLLWLGMGKVR